MPTNIGFSVQSPGAGANLNLGTISNFYNGTNGVWSISFVINFADDVANTYFGNTGNGSRAFYIKRNADGTSRIQIIDSAGAKREVVYSSSLKYKTWYRITFVSSASGSGNLKMYVNGTEQNISSQTHDAGFAPETAFALRFGEAESGVTSGFSVSRMYFYSSALTQAQITAINIDQYPSGYIAAFRCDGPNIGV